MAILFSENFEKLVKFIFNFYDFDKDGLISKEDVRVVLSYIPLNLSLKKNYSNLKLKFEKEDFKDRIESQDELYTLLEKSFESNSELDYNKFLYVIENISSDIFLYILIFLMDKKPFSNNTLKQFKGRKFDCSAIRINLTPKLQSRLIASPNLNSKFSPSVTIKKSPMMSKRLTLDSDGNKKLANGNVNESKNFLMKFAGANTNNTNAVNSNNLNVNDLRNGIKKSGTVNFSNEEKVKNIGKENINRTNSIDNGFGCIDEDGNFKNVRVNRKIRNDLKKLEETEVSKKSKFLTVHESSDLPIVPGIKYQAIRSTDRLETLK